ncbi:hypothetical protein TTHERM_000172936 (macronuclear) [Tetrahymena thermophila SB210]|uniref:Uncharacterized protein n=1 Tax=Tetrahymena thermophila (strain SB210) TaxID=312017 RepID=W7X9W2_TETTS|nr:hypothetical protein TTHERM_000172936 [Tetrahymena thermophila SB210]EWS76205.1 hypothetical protein TTHERM_000172936 [Tetrahymena thermophila SB210]|eukprot:XP_012651252.1 hypothetical protein TTHERM_000172936 [Tetrahymena thermophila SB210]
MQATANEDVISNETLLNIEVFGNKQLKKVELEVLITTDLQQQLKNQYNSTYIRVTRSSISKERLSKNNN